MKGPFRNKQGSTLLEIIVAIAVLGLMVAPVCSSLVLSHRLNAEAEKVLEARLLVESTVEQLMAEGISYEKDPESGEYELANTLPDGVEVITGFIPPVIDEETGEVENPQYWYKVIVNSLHAEDVSIQTIIKAAPVFEDELKGPGGSGV